MPIQKQVFSMIMMRFIAYKLKIISIYLKKISNFLTIYNINYLLLCILNIYNNELFLEILTNKSKMDIVERK